MFAFTAFACIFLYFKYYLYSIIIIYILEYFVFKAKFINLYWATEIIPILEKICFISF